MSERTARIITLLGAAVMLAHTVVGFFYLPPPRWLSVLALLAIAWWVYYGWAFRRRRSTDHNP